MQPGIFLRPRMHDFNAWISLPVASEKRGQEVDVNPMVGVRHEATEAIVDDGPAAPTFLRPLYEVRDDRAYRTWAFDREHLSEQATALADEIENEAIPWLESLTTLSGLEAALRECAFADTRRARLPAVVLQRHGRDAARAEVDRELADLRNAGDEDMRREYAEQVDRLLGGD